MSNRLFTFSILWIFVWSIFALDQLIITFNNVFDKSLYVQAQEATSVETENNLNSESKPGVNDIIQSTNCRYQNFWDDVKFTMSDDNSSLYLTFPKTPVEQGVNKVLLNIYPDFAKSYPMYGFKLHEISELKIDISERVQKIDLNIIGNDFGIDTTWHFEIVGKDKQSNECYSKVLFSLDKSNFQNFTQIEPYYAESIFNPADELFFNVENIGEDAYIENFFENQKLKNLNKFLPEPHEAGLALLEKNLSELDGNYEERSIWFRNRLHGDVVIGLYGDVKDSDLKTVSQLIKTLHIIAPDLNISYSSKSEYVNLPIHFLPCTSLVSEKGNGCKDHAIGLFYYPESNKNKSKGKYGWIWVDTQHSSFRRSHILVHEVGHALGLGHNRCWDSTMTYSSSSPEIAHFSESDLMQLRILYDTRLPVLISSEYTAEKLNLDKDKLKTYQDKPSEACNAGQAGWSDLIDFQVGKIKLDEMYGG